MNKRKRTMTDEEIGLVKAMLRRGMRNDLIHFYFNRADRLISSGRVAQIKTGKYGASVEEATSAVLDAFLAEWEARRATPSVSATSPVDRRALLSMFTEGSPLWTMAAGETDHIECKRNYRLTGDVIKSIAGLSNNKGGYIFFGVSDRTFTIDGMDDETFDDTDPAEINRSLSASLDPVPHLTKCRIEIGDRSVGVLYVAKHDHAPVMALKNIGSDLKEGAIYFRYVGETRAIKPGELRQIIAMREQRAVAEFSQRMMRVAAGAEATLNLETGEVKGKSGGFLIDKALLPSIQFIREGDFSEVRGAPALRLVGDVEPVDATERERVRVIRDTVTPDAVVRNFLRGERVADPIQYIHVHAHCQRRWLPIWFYVDQARVPIEELIEGLRSEVATHPSSRDAVVQRLRKTVKAHKVHIGRPARLCAEFASGSIIEPVGGPDDLVFANALMGLPPGVAAVEQFRPILLACLDRAERDRNGTRRSAIYRAACRLDELLHGDGAVGPSG